MYVPVLQPQLHSRVVLVPSHFGPESFRPGRFGLSRFGPGSFRPNLVGQFGLYLIKPWQQYRVGECRLGYVIKGIVRWVQVCRLR